MPTKDPGILTQSLKVTKGGQGSGQDQWDEPDDFNAIGCKGGGRTEKTMRNGLQKMSHFLRPILFSLIHSVLTVFSVVNPSSGFTNSPWNAR